MTTGRLCKAGAVVQRLISLAGEMVVALTVLVILYNLVDAAIAKPAFYRVTISTLCFAAALIATAIRPRFGISLCVFLAPLLPNVTFQIQAFLGYGRILPVDTPGFDLAAGLFVGALAHRFLQRSGKGTRTWPVIDLPWQAGLALLYLSLSALLAIARNLAQSQSLFELPALVLSLQQIRAISWHDDYRPLVDLVAYGAAGALLAILVPALRARPDRNDIVFKPLVYGVLIAAAIGCAQSATGIGLRLTQLVFRNDRLGYTALGFQPDIHAFAGHMLLGVCGLLGYWIQTPSRVMRILIPVAVVPLASVALVLSKSKSSVALAIVLMAVLALAWGLRHAPRARRVLAWGALAAVCALGASFYFWNDAWLAGLTWMAQRRGFADLEAVNFELARRPEIFMAGLRMFSEFPLLGLGQGEFYRLSANFAFSKSPFLAQTLNGENAHNYFLQVLAENGLIGVALFTLMLASPICRVRHKVVLVPALVALASVLVGNIYAHSLLVRENLLVAAALVSLLYAWARVEAPFPGAQAAQPACWWARPGARVVLALLAIGVMLAAAFEAKRSLHRFPFTQDVQCQVLRPQTPDGWTTGLYREPMPLGARGITFVLGAAPPDAGARPLSAEVQVIHEKRGVLATRTFMIAQPGAQRLGVTLPENVLVDDDDYWAVVKLQRCFIPKNLGINGDGRRLGMLIKSVEFD